MNKPTRTLLAGVVTVVPIAATAYVVWWAATSLGALGYKLADYIGLVNNIARPDGTSPGDGRLAAFVGVLIVLAAIYAIGLLTRWAVFRWTLDLLDRWISHLPGVKVVYESIRDLLKLFGGNTSQMGRAVLYHVPGTEITLLGILTNEKPAGFKGHSGNGKVAIYIPFSYMLGGMVLYASPEHIEDSDLTVDQAMKLAATAHVGQCGPAAVITDDKPPCDV